MKIEVGAPEKGFVNPPILIWKVEILGIVIDIAVSWTATIEELKREHVP